VEQDGSVRLSELDIKSGAVDASGSVALAGSTLSADIQGTLPELGRLLADAKGSAAFHAVASGPLNKLGIEAEITSSGATLAGRTLDDLVVNADATVTPGSPEAKLTATGTLDGQAIDVRANVVTRDGRTSIPTLEAKIGDNRLTGAMELTADYKPNGTIDFNLPDLGLLAAMAGQQASGDLAGSATIRTADGVTSLALTARGESIRRDALTVAKPVVDVTVADLARLAIKGGVRAESVVQGENRLTDIDIAFEQEAERTGFSVGAEFEGAPLAATGDLASRDGRTEISLASASATARRIPLQLARPSVIAIENGVVHIDGLTIQASTGTVAVTGTAGETLDISADISDLPATLIHTVAPTLGAEGKITGKVDIAGNGAAPVVRYDLTWSGASIASVRSARHNGRGPVGEGNRDRRSGQHPPRPLGHRTRGLSRGRDGQSRPRRQHGRGEFPVRCRTRRAAARHRRKIRCADHRLRQGRDRRRRHRRTERARSQIRYRQRHRFGRTCRGRADGRDSGRIAGSRQAAR
jgi:translocation and assembly module TamB